MQQHFNVSSARSLRLKLPPLVEQIAIRSILGALDDKIELNRRMNQTLEAMARAIFKAWFVDCERGWGIASFLDTAEVVGGGTPKTSIPGYWDGGIPWFSVADAPPGSDTFVIATQKNISESGLKDSATSLLPFGSTIISARGTVGKVALVGVPMAMNQSCYGIVPNRFGPFFTYFSTQEIVTVLKQRSHGSVFDTITRDTLAGISVVTPPPEVAANFDRHVGPYLMKILENLKQSCTLSSLRDALLPKLLSGEIRIKQAEKIVGVAL